MGCKKFSWRELFSSQPFLTLHVFYGVLNYAKLDVAWPKTVKTHKLPRLIWAAKSSRGANFFHPSHFSRYISFATSQPRKNGRFLAQNSENKHFATFNLSCKKFSWNELFSSQPFPTLHIFYGVPTTQIGRCLVKNSENTQLATFNLCWKKFARCELFSSQPFCTLHVFYGVPALQKWPLLGQKQ